MRRDIIDAEAVSEPGQGPEPEDVFSQEISLSEILRLLKRRTRFIFLFAFCLAALTAGIEMLIPNAYTAVSVIMPPAQGSSAGSSMLAQLGGNGAIAAAAGASLGVKNPADMYISLFHSRTVEDAMVERFGLMERYHQKFKSRARVALSKHAGVSLGAKDGLISISATDRDPRFAADLANGYVEEFSKYSANLALTEASQRRVFFQRQLLEAKQNLATAENALKTTEQTTGVLQVDSQTRMLIESSASLRAQVVAKEVQIQAMRVYATEDNPEMLQTKQQLSALQGQLSKLGGSDQDSGLLVPKGKIPEAGLEYLRKLRDVKYYDAISELVARQFEVAKLDEARQGAIIQVVDAAVPPDTKSGPKRAIIVLMAFFVSLFLACGWAIFGQGLRRRIRQSK